MTVPKFNPKWVYGACLALWTTYLLIIAVPNIIDTFPAIFMWLPVIFGWAGLLSVASLVLLVIGLQSPKSKQKALRARPANPVIVRTAAGLLAACLPVSAYCAVHCLSLDISYAKFAYQNVATGTAFAALVLIFILSSLQHDAFWISRSRSMQLDELQLRERYAVFELSYKIGAWLVALTAILFYSHAHAIQHILQNPVNGLMLSTVFLPLGDLALALFALPLVIAAFRGLRVKNTK